MASSNRWRRLRILSIRISRAFYQALVNTINHDGIEHSGYIAFLALLSFFPFMVLFFSIAGSIGQTDMGIVFVEFLLDKDLINPRILDGLQPRVAEIVSGPPQGLLTVSILGAIWTASSTFEGLRTTLNRAYHVGTPPAYIWRRLWSIAEMLCLMGVVIFVSVILIIAPTIWETILNHSSLSFLEKAVEFLQITSDENKNTTWFHYGFTAFILFTVVSIAYYTLPNIQQSLLSVAPGAGLVVILWFITGHALAFYLSDFQQVNIIYGSLGGVIACLLFFFLSSMSFIYGAEFNYLFERALGHKIIEREYVPQMKISEK